MVTKGEMRTRGSLTGPGFSLPSGLLLWPAVNLQSKDRLMIIFMTGNSDAESGMLGIAHDRL